MRQTVVVFQTPDADALRQKTKDEWRDRRLEGAADCDARRRIFLVNQSRNLPGNKVGLGRFPHVFIDHPPRVLDEFGVTRIATISLRDDVVETRANVGWLEINDSNICARKLELERHNE